LKLIGRQFLHKTKSPVLEVQRFQINEWHEILFDDDNLTIKVSQGILTGLPMLIKNGQIA
jgi:hypothetical protein